MHIRADIEDENLDCADLPLDPLDQRRDIGLDARVEPEGVSLAALGANRRRQPVDRLGMPGPPGDADPQALAGEGVRDRGAEPVARADHQADARSVAHEPKPQPANADTAKAIAFNPVLLVRARDAARLHCA